MEGFTHLGPDGAARMVDVGDKPATARTAIAGATMTLEAATLKKILGGGTAKGEVLQVARIAGIQGAKRTSELIPLCHSLGLDHVAVTFQKKDDTHLDLFAAARLHAKTGVEMEALTAVSVAGLTVYDMCKAIDRQMVISNVQLLLKTGGKAPWCRLKGVVSAAVPGGAPGAPVRVTWGPGDGPPEAGPWLAIQGIPGDLLPDDCWLVFESGVKGVLTGDAQLDFPDKGDRTLPPPGTRITVRLGESWAA